jgi:hypothetical protein
VGEKLVLWWWSQRSDGALRPPHVCFI